MVKFFDIYDAIIICDVLDEDIVHPIHINGILYNEYIEHCRAWHKIFRINERNVNTSKFVIPCFLIKEATEDEGMDDIVKRNNKLLEMAKKHKKFKSKFYLWMNYV